MNPNPLDTLSLSVLNAILAYDATGAHSPLPWSGEHTASTDCIRCAIARALPESLREQAAESCRRALAIRLTGSPPRARGATGAAR